ncbi:hypothetical protein BD309DRAFT_961237 [Dichomitus squalens]|nr:hypothetical protein BD309DRAFT_961237 [Dichomitus squalens]
MAKRSQPTQHESSDDEAPEAVSFDSSKKTAKGEQNVLKKHHAVLKRKKKDKNRAHDRALKERSASIRGKGKETDRPAASRRQSRQTEAEVSEDEDSDLDDPEAGSDGVGGRSKEELEARMARAMAEAEDESEAEDDDEESAGSESDVQMEGEGFDEEVPSLDEEMSSAGDDSEEEGENEEAGEGDEDEAMGSDEGEDEDEDEEDDLSEDPPLAKSSGKANYLPEHLFKAALSNAGKKIVFDEDCCLTTRKQSSPSRKRKRTERSSRDILLGSRTIRTLPKPTTVASPFAAKGLAPPRRVTKFVKTSLNLKGDAAKSKSKGWSRRPANLGVMKRSGPAANFVRDS